MKLGFISDIHIDYNQDYPVKEKLLQICKLRGIDKLIIAGDISGDAEITLDFIHWMNKNGVYTDFVFGNHDYYGHPNILQLREEHNTFPNIFSNWGIIGDTGWYDYSWNTVGNLNRLQRGKFGSHGISYTWPDHRFIKYPEELEGDRVRAFCKLNLESMQKQKEDLDRLGFTNKILVMHMVPHNFILEQSYEYLETNTFFGSERISRWIKEIAPKVVIFGHTHFPKDFIQDGTHYICRPLGYHIEWPSTRNLEEHIDNMLYEMEIDNE